jgi:hypothetical protein
LHDVDVDIDEDLDLDRQDDKACRPAAPKPQKCGARTLSRHEKDFVQTRKGLCPVGTEMETTSARENT